MRLILFFSILLYSSTVFSQNELTPPDISKKSGFYKKDFRVKISTQESDVTILYTLDGSEPRMENLEGKQWSFKQAYPSLPGDAFGNTLVDTIWTYKYENPLQIHDRSKDKDRYADISTSPFQNKTFKDKSGLYTDTIYKGTNLRAVAYKDGNYSKIVTRNYFITRKGKNRYSFPVICLSVNPQELFGYRKGLDVPGKKFDDWRISHPRNRIRLWTPGNFRMKGRNSEIRVNFNYLVDGKEELNQNSGLRLHGNSSRIFPNRSFRLYARKEEYGAKEFNYPFFPNYSQNKFKRIILRSSGNDTQWTMFRDAFTQIASKNLNVDIQESQPSIVFINGEYFGIYNIRERIDKKYFKEIYGIPEDSLDYIKRNIVKNGSYTPYNKLVSYVKNNPLKNQDNYTHVSHLMDIDNYTDYNIAEIYFGNIDWPDNNFNHWRKRVPYDSTVEGENDGRWRWELTDFDLSLGNTWKLLVGWEGVEYKYDNLTRATTVQSNSKHIDNYTVIIRGLLKNENYKAYFINRFCDIVNTNYKTEVLLDLLNRMKERTEPEMEEFIQRWTPNKQYHDFTFPPSTYSKWEGYVDDIKIYLKHRPYWTRKHLQNRFNTGDSVVVTLEISDFNKGYIKLNTLTIDEKLDGVNAYQPYPWSGTYFEDIPIVLEAIPRKGYRFSHWSGGRNGTTTKITVNLNKDNSKIKANFVPNK